jgi:hypothetical protein
MGFAPPYIPQISVSPPPPDEPLVEPYSPFSCTTAIIPNDENSYRPHHLTPPPTHVGFSKPLSPLRPSEAPTTGHGLERERFEALLKASRERNSAVGAKKGNDLRKEIALKTHKNKQFERRALFLSKVLAPPSPTAASTPKTPPDSPAIFHYTLPSPGLVSPLALFESLNDGPACNPLTYPREPWVEQVDFRVPDKEKSKQFSPKVPTTTLISRNTASAKPLPSLDQISARLSSQRHIHMSSSEGEAVTRAARRLPVFLTQPRQSSHPGENTRLPVGVGRLQLDVRSPKPSKAEGLLIFPPGSPCSPLTPNLQVTTLRVPRTATMSPTELSESNVQALDSRARRAHDMLSTIRRRTPPSECSQDLQDGEDRKWKRNSCPAEVAPRERSGFDHPVLSIPGGF